MFILEEEFSVLFHVFDFNRWIFKTGLLLLSRSIKVFASRIYSVH